jgi:hypothetical protein
MPAPLADNELSDKLPELVVGSDYVKPKDRDKLWQLVGHSLGRLRYRP